MLLLLLILYPMMLLSPPESMGPFMRYASLVSPGRHYVDFGYQVLFKGNGFSDVWPDVVGILALGVLLFLVSIRRFARLAC
jgi:ABC-2 type transport system permease protein